MIKQKDRIIVFITDRNQSLYTLTNSIIINNQTKIKVKFRLIFVDADELLKNKIHKILKFFKLSNILPIFLNSHDFYLASSIPIHISNVANLRLYLSKIFPKEKSVLYLDADTIVDGDINVLFDYCNYNNHYAVKDSLKSKRKETLVKKRLMDNKSDYVNSGVLFLSLDKIRSENNDLRFNELLLNNKFLYMDQDIINSVLIFEYLPWFFNDGKKSFPKYLDELNDQLPLHIYHFLMFDKQWSNIFPSITTYKKRKLYYKKKWKIEYNKMLEAIK